ncbi:hypothetical protein L7F22_052230 [Adiantum nelumboides]|nr:hypothetical protein [Adiantum nelumboides]
MRCPFQLSKYGIELQFATNHLGFWLISLLLETIKNTATKSKIEGRIVILSSSYHKYTYSEGIRLEKLNSLEAYSHLHAYGQSKLLNLLHCYELAGQLKILEIVLNLNWELVTDLSSLFNQFSGSSFCWSVFVILVTDYGLVADLKLETGSWKLFSGSSSTSSQDQKLVSFGSRFELVADLKSKTGFEMFVDLKSETGSELVVDLKSKPFWHWFNQFSSSGFYWSISVILVTDRIEIGINPGNCSLAQVQVLGNCSLVQIQSVVRFRFLLILETVLGLNWELVVDLSDFCGQRVVCLFYSKNKNILKELALKDRIGIGIIPGNHSLAQVQVLETVLVLNWELVADLSGLQEIGSTSSQVQVSTGSTNSQVQVFTGSNMVANLKSETGSTSSLIQVSTGFELVDDLKSENGSTSSQVQVSTTGSELVAHLKSAIVSFGSSSELVADLKSETGFELVADLKSETSYLILALVQILGNCSLVQVQQVLRFGFQLILEIVLVLYWELVADLSGLIGIGIIPGNCSLAQIQVPGNCSLVQVQRILRVGFLLILETVLVFNWEMVADLSGLFNQFSGSGFYWSVFVILVTGFELFADLKSKSGSTSSQVQPVLRFSFLVVSFCNSGYWFNQFSGSGFYWSVSVILVTDFELVVDLKSKTGSGSWKLFSNSVSTSSQAQILETVLVLNWELVADLFGLRLVSFGLGYELVADLKSKTGSRSGSLLNTVLWLRFKFLETVPWLRFNQFSGFELVADLKSEIARIVIEIILGNCSLLQVQILETVLVLYWELVADMSGLFNQFSGSGFYWSVFVMLVTGTYYPSTLDSEPSAGTQGSGTQDPHIAASDSSSDFDIMEGHRMQHPESSSQDMHALGQQPGTSMFSRLKETLSRATRSQHATNEINEGSGEVDSPFTSQIDSVLFESAHVSTPATTPIGPSKLTPFETLLPNGRSLAEVQEVERYILATREKEIESLRKAEQRQAILAKAPMTSTLSANTLQSSKLTALKSQTIGSHIASGSKDTFDTSVLDGVFLNENWEYNLQTEKLINLYTSYAYHTLYQDTCIVMCECIRSTGSKQRLLARGGNIAMCIESIGNNQCLLAMAAVLPHMPREGACLGGKGTVGTGNLGTKAFYESAKRGSNAGAVEYHPRNMGS